MATWGPGIFEDSLAIEVRTEFESAVNSGKSVYAAAEFILEKYSDRTGDIDDGPVIYFVLAEMQLAQDLIQTKIRKKALSLINRDESIDRWKKSEHFEARKAVLQDLRTRLNSQA